MSMRTTTDICIHALSEVRRLSNDPPEADASAPAEDRWRCVTFCVDVSQQAAADLMTASEAARALVLTVGASKMRETLARCQPTTVIHWCAGLVAADGSVPLWCEMERLEARTSGDVLCFALHHNPNAPPRRGMR